MLKPLFVFLINIFFNFPIIAQNKGDAILGTWVNEKKDAKILIFKKQNKYFGKVVWGTGSDPKDSKNPDPKLRNRELMGLTILSDFIFNDIDTWKEGAIYDPREGKYYSSKITVESATKIKIRGYWGISLLGRTESWYKTN